MMQNKVKMILGLTGGSGVGKTTVATLLKECGAFVIEADKVGHIVIEPGQPAYYEIIQYFGEEYLQVDGHIDRRKLGRTVFSDRQALDKLNQITHPRIKEHIEKQCIHKQNDLVVVDAALLFEVGLHEMCDCIWRVVAPEADRIQRIMKRDALTFEEATNRIRAQKHTNANNSPVTLEILNEGDTKLLRSIVEHNLLILRGIGCE